MRYYERTFVHSERIYVEQNQKRGEQTRLAIIQRRTDLFVPAGLSRHFDAPDCRECWDRFGRVV